MDSMEERIAELNRQTEQEQVEVSNIYFGKRVYTVEEIQNILGISRPTAYNLVKSKAFRSVKVGGQIRIPVSSFDAWLDSAAMSNV